MLTDKIKLESDEKITSQTRRHWFVLVSQLFLFVIGALMPALLLLLSPILLGDFTELNLSVYKAELTYLYSIWLVFMWFGSFSIWTNYYLDLLILTDRRVILLNQKGFFRRNVASFRLERLQDMNVEINGIVATLLDYGTINVETAGHSDEEFRATGLPNPREIKAIIMRASDERLKERGRASFAVGEDL